MELEKLNRHQDEIDKQKRERNAKRFSIVLLVLLCFVLGAVFMPGGPKVLIGDFSVFQPQTTEPKTAEKVFVSAKRIGDETGAGADGQLANIPYFAGDDYFISDNVNIKIETVVENDITYYVAHVKIKDFSALKTARYVDDTGEKVKQNVMLTALQNDAVLAINADFYTFRDAGIIIRNGEVLDSHSWGMETLCFYDDGTMAVVDAADVTPEELLADGVTNSFFFGPAMIVDGVVQTSRLTGSDLKKVKHPRTGIGYIAPGEYVWICVDGRKAGYSVGVTITEFAAIFEKYNVQLAYNLDGGGSTTMVFMGRLINKPQGRTDLLRKVDNIIYIWDENFVPEAKQQ